MVSIIPYGKFFSTSVMKALISIFPYEIQKEFYGHFLKYPWQVISFSIQGAALPGASISLAKVEALYTSEVRSNCHWRRSGFSVVSSQVSEGRKCSKTDKSLCWHLRFCVKSCRTLRQNCFGFWKDFLIPMLLK